MIPYNTPEELRALAGKIIKHKTRDYTLLIVEAIHQEASIGAPESMWVKLGADTYAVHLDELFEYYEFLDGSPIGKPE